MSKPWFAPKQFGYGSSLPISWEGWVALLVFAAGFTAIPFAADALLPGHSLAPKIVAMALWLVAFALICRARTEGGWRWRNGNDT